MHADLVREILGDGGALSRALSGYEARAEQLSMAEAVTQTLADRGTLLVEAGTGTGKSLAYLVPAALSGMRVVVSTATKNLGTQLIERDLPLLERVGLQPKIALVKGLGNYVCLRRLEEYRRAVATGAQRFDPHLDAVLAFAAEGESGDRADLASVPEDAAVWREVSSSSDTRIGARCAHYENCFVTKMKRRAEAAEILVTNHHLFCADLALRSQGYGAQVLPDYDAVIFDEAHALEEVATEFFGVRVTRSRIDHLVRDAARAYQSPGVSGSAGASDLGRVLAVLSAGAQRLFTSLPRPSGRDGGARMLLSPDTFYGPLGEAAGAILSACEELIAMTEPFLADDESLLSLLRRARGLHAALGTVMDLDDPSHVSYADADARGGGALSASPVEIGPMFERLLFNQGHAIVLTSATLSTAGETGFGFIRKRLGVPDDARELALASPFDYGAQAAIYVPNDIHEPRDERYFDRAVEEICRLVRLTAGGAFVLCTSVRQMRAFASVLRDELSFPLFVQGEAPKATLINRFREAGNAVLVATSSFWEGVDVPGRALRLVIIDKLPFEAPNDPLTAARIQRLTDAGRKPFQEYQLPVAALALKQGFGRLIRTRRDAGIVAVLDGRLVSRGYGKRLLAALPPASRCRSLEELEAFWTSVDAGE